jgi:hypothetical protein
LRIDQDDRQAFGTQALQKILMKNTDEDHPVHVPLTYHFRQTAMAGLNDAQDHVMIIERQFRFDALKHLGIKGIVGKGLPVPAEEKTDVLGETGFQSFGERIRTVPVGVRDFEHFLAGFCAHVAPVVQRF